MRLPRPVLPGLPLFHRFVGNMLVQGGLFYFVAVVGRGLLPGSTGSRVLRKAPSQERSAVPAKGGPGPMVAQIVSFFVFNREQSWVPLVLIAGGFLGAVVAVYFVHPHTHGLPE